MEKMIFYIFSVFKQFVVTNCEFKLFKLFLALKSKYENKYNSIKRKMIIIHGENNILYLFGFQKVRSNEL